MPRSNSPVIKKNNIVPKPVTLPSVQHKQTMELERPGFLSTVWRGFGLGAGQSIAHNIFRSEPQIKVVQEQPILSKDYTQCLKDNNNDKDLCKQFIN